MGDEKHTKHKERGITDPEKIARKNEEVVGPHSGGKADEDTKKNVPPKK